MVTLTEQGLSRRSFDAVVKYFETQSGIRLGPDKHALVQGRVQKLAHERGERDLDNFVNRVLAGADSGALTQLVDRLTTNETYFFRESEHFQFLAQLVTQPLTGGSFRAWSAASSSGEEAYSIAMVLADRLGLTRPWEVVGTDLSTEVVHKASRALYPISRAKDIPDYYRQRYCLKGHGPHANHMLVARTLRERTRMPLVFQLRAAPTWLQTLATELPGQLAGADIVLQQREPGLLELRCPREHKMRVLAWLANAELSDLQIHEPSLEDVYFGLREAP